MENPVPKELKERSPAEPGPRVILIATFVAFGGTVAVYGFKPWGPWVGSALMVGWAGLLYVSSIAQDGRDRRAGRVPAQPEPRRISTLERFLRAVVPLAAAAYFAWSFWLRHQGASEDTVQSVRDTATFLMLLGILTSMSVEMIFSWLDRRRNAPGTTRA